MPKTRISPLGRFTINAPGVDIVLLENRIGAISLSHGRIHLRPRLASRGLRQPSIEREGQETEEAKFLFQSAVTH
jgi:hypothetical protein